jgi:hypothetical protein
MREDDENGDIENESEEGAVKHELNREDDKELF